MVVRQSISKKDLREARAAKDRGDKKKARKELKKRISEHPIHLLLRRAATTGELPHKDELDALNVTAKYRKDIEAAARRIKHESESPPEADEQRSRSGKVKVRGYTSPQFAARSMAWDKAESLIAKLPSNHETKEETEARQASVDPEAVAEKVWKQAK